MSNPYPQLTQSQLDHARKPIVYRVPDMDRVTVHSNLRYCDSPETRILMDVYIPPDVPTNSTCPAVLFVHGGVPGALPVKEMGSFRSWGRLIAAQGVVAVTFTHRLQWPLSQLTEATFDVRSAIDYVRDNAPKFGIDANRLCIIAMSAGGPLLTLSIRDRLEYVRCQVALWPLLDLDGIGFGQAGVDQTRIDHPEQFALRTYLRDSAFKPLFIARAGKDATPGLNVRLDRFVGEALAANAPVTLVNHPAGVHGFDVENDDERSREIIRNVMAFVQTHIGAAADR
ncbi:MAG TPA: alpha/beta hydrolase [Steroidobacteraceae bacterium]|nr:alpha/beta hydrolase [Steroidobacteraceae bacterium]